MATYVIGDIHGYYGSLRAMFERIDFDPDTDRVWFVGDLVNGGERNREVVEFVRELGDAATVCLGNHDLHMLAVWAGAHPLREKDTFADLLDAPNGDELCEWLRTRSIVHHEADALVVHAALWPEWSAEKAAAIATELETALRAPDPKTFFDEMYGNDPRTWSDDLEGHDRLRFAVNVFTRARCITDDGELDFDHKGTLEQLPRHLTPWFDRRVRHHRDATVYFGHWSALGMRLRPGAVCLDSGVRWGRWLTALRREDGALFAIEQLA